jgi:hypothetical protein
MHFRLEQRKLSRRGDSTSILAAMGRFDNSMLASTGFGNVIRMSWEEAHLAPCSDSISKGKKLTSLASKSEL